MSQKLKTTICGIDLENPLMPASGPLVGDDEKMLAIAGFKVGAMVTKTISKEGAMVPRPCIYGGRDYIMNAELWSEFEPSQWIDEFLPNVKENMKIPLIISVGYNKEDMALLIPQLDPFADAFEISTHYVGKNLNDIAETVRTIRANTDKPFFMKISPHIPDPIAFAKMVLENGGNGVVAINSLGPTMKIDLNKRQVLVGNELGEVWSSGPAIKPLALALVHRIKKALPQCTVIGVGGIATAQDVIEFLLAGADGVQMLSAAMLQGKDLYKKIIKDLPQTLDQYGFKSIEEVIQTRLKPVDITYTIKNYPQIIKEKCILCKKCEKVCPYFAIKYCDESIYMDESKCFGCGLCQSQCPVKAIENVF
ncbi:dihydroorotate dehydrogenase (fumarate) [Natranaerovirga hydrolytica]|uniref:dihydrouracil dehydrogenase (NAD(+)) n=1 Tax=Natranaerovirga hydrolytica TaxID=680378 RepID=A0A4R1MYY4_9FIRM|nr:4Fe-4S binding protein [Natranaerovirga hydrolytica]TCK97752.1 dihydroorotate dehydrogenase (fumarate) [Natranaerovirga hydrolytica]